MKHRKLSHLLMKNAGPMLALSTLIWSISFQTYAHEFKQQQVAGYYHFSLGNFQITALYDGYTQLETEVFQGLPQQRIQNLLNSHFVNSQQGIQTSVNAYLVNTGNQLILIDSGTAKCMGDTLGSIEENLKAAGYQADQIDAILLTHLHPDHSCGISVVEGQKSFPKATVYVNQAEFDFWNNIENIKKFPKDKQALFAGVVKTIRTILKPYQDAQQLKTYKVGDQVIDGIGIVPSYGHTAGHSSYLVQSGEAKLLVLGDVVHNHALQFSHPNISFAFDFDAKQATKTREIQFKQAAEKGYWLAGAHLPFPGIGHIKQVKPNQFVWLPVEYNPLIKPNQTPK